MGLRMWWRRLCIILIQSKYSLFKIQIWFGYILGDLDLLYLLFLFMRLINKLWVLQEKFLVDFIYIK